MKKIYLLFGLSIVIITFSYAQSVGVGIITPNASAMLDISATNKGLLMPRIALSSVSDAVTIPSPAAYLMIVNTNASLPDGIGLYVNMGTPSSPNWVKTGAGSASSNAWSLSGNPGTVEATSFIGTTDNIPFNIRVNNQKAGRIDHILNNAFLGYQAGNSNTSGNQNTATGGSALQANTSGIQNTATGFAALGLNTTGNFNTATGAYALYPNTTGYDNTANGSFSLRYNTTGFRNTANGSSALRENTIGNYNTANGFSALYNNTTGYSNVAIGAGTLFTNTIISNLVAVGDSALFNNRAGPNLSGTANVAIGSKALFSNTEGYQNTAVGYNSLYSDLSGSGNSAIGFKALYSNESGSANTALGHRSLLANTVGYSNTAIGVDALKSNIIGHSNIAIGQYALNNNESGVQNTGCGYVALALNKYGYWNTALGYEADVTSDNLVNTTALGYQSKVNISNKVRIGNTSVQVIEGQVAYSFPSDSRFKYNIKSNVPGLDFIKKLTPVTYYFDEKKLEEYSQSGVINNSIIQFASYKGDKQLHSGFLAQDVEKISKELGYEFDGVHAPQNNKDHYSLAYSQFIMPLVKSVQEQQKLIEDQRNDIDTLKSQVAELTKALKTISKK